MNRNRRYFRATATIAVATLEKRINTETKSSRKFVPVCAFFPRSVISEIVLCVLCHLPSPPPLSPPSAIFARAIFAALVHSSKAVVIIFHHRFITFYSFSTGLCRTFSLVRFFFLRSALAAAVWLVISMQYSPVFFSHWFWCGSKCV